MKNINLLLNYFFGLIVFLCLTNIITCQTYNLSGYIYTDSIIVQNASVTLIDNSNILIQYKTTTDTTGFFELDLVTNVETKDQALPTSFELAQNYPNPFNSKTAIGYKINKESNIEVKIFDILGREVKSFKPGLQSAGLYNIVWDGRNNNNRQAAPGIYFYQISNENESIVKKMILNSGYKNGDLLTLNQNYFPTGPSPQKNSNNIDNAGYTVLIESKENTYPVIVKHESQLFITSPTSNITFHVERARIILGYTIDGVLLGDDSLTVINKLGEPIDINDDPDVVYIFNYPGIELSVRKPLDDSLGTFVAEIKIFDPYSGKTKEGICIGTDRESVLSLIGLPLSSESNSDKYYFEPLPGCWDNLLYFVYDGNEELIQIKFHGLSP